jgi:hypothetical protein
MSQSKADVGKTTGAKSASVKSASVKTTGAKSAGVKAAGKAKQPKPSPRPDAVETLRIIPAPVPATMPDLALTDAEKARSAQAKVLASSIEQGLRGGERAVVMEPEAVQALLSALCKVYSQHVETIERYDAFSTSNPVTPTDVMVTASGLLKAANLAVFELGMWQSWTGR